MTIFRHHARPHTVLDGVVMQIAAVTAEIETKEAYQEAIHIVAADQAQDGFLQQKIGTVQAIF